MRCRTVRAVLTFNHSNPELLCESVGILLADTPIANTQFQQLIDVSLSRHFTVRGPNGSVDYQNLTRTWLERRDSARLSILNAIGHQAKLFGGRLSSRSWPSTVPPPLRLPDRAAVSDKSQFQLDANEPTNLERDGIIAISEYVPGQRFLLAARPIPRTD